MSLDKAREELEQFEKRAALAEKQIKELSVRIAKLEQAKSQQTDHSAKPPVASHNLQLIARFPKQEPALAALVVAQLVGETEVKFTPKPDQDGVELAQYPQG